MIHFISIISDMSLHLQNIDYLIEVFFKPFKVETIKNFIKNVIISLFRVIINRLLILLHFNNLSILYNHDNKRILFNQDLQQ